MLVMAGGALYQAAIAHDAVATNHRRCGRVDEDPLAEKQECAGRNSMCQRIFSVQDDA